MKHHFMTIPALAALLLLGAAQPARAQQDQEQGAFLLSSTEFTDGGVLDSKFTCDAAGISPPLKWENAPSHTQSYAITIVDPDAPGGNHIHWIAYNIPGTTHELPVNAAAEATLGVGAEQGVTTGGKANYEPPCPPTGEHHYVIRAYALDSTLDLPTGTNVDKKAFDAAILGHVLAQSELTARYARHKS